MALNEESQKKLLLGILIFLVIVLLFIVYLIYGQLKNAEKTANATISPTPTATLSGNVSITYNLDNKDENTDSVKDIANKFMQAKLDQSYDDAKIYMSDELKQKLNQETFVATSGAEGSSIMDRFEIISVNKLSDAIYEVKINSYWPINALPDKEVIYFLELIKKDNDFLVNNFI